MANEFKIKKGLIVTGASGGTVVDIQGSQGQLFSVTDDLSGSIFAVSDISGVPILDVNSSGAVNIDGTLIGSSTAYFSGAITTNLSLEGTYFTGGSGGIRQLSITSGTNTSAHALHTFNIASSNGKYEFDVNGTTELSLDSSNATFAGDVLAPRFDIGTDSTSIIQETNRIKFTNSIANDAGGFDFYTRKTDSAYVNALQILGTGDSTFAAQAFSAATSSGDGSSTLTTKGYVDGLITGATIYRGAWDPSGGGYGSPDLSGVTQTSGYYYICSAAGTAEPNGTGTEPDTWAVGDWVIYNDVSGTGQWQKIDNSSVLSGVGTGQTVALWEGAGSVTDSETLGNAPITVSGNDTTFAGNITALTGAGSGNITVGRNANEKTIIDVGDQVNSITAYQDADGNATHNFTLNRVFGGTGANDFKIQKGGTDQFTLDTSANATFAGTITGQNIYGNQFVDAQDNAYYANPAMTSVMKGASFDGDVTVTTQAVGDDSTLVATTEYADRAAANIPIGNYLPLSAGSSYPLTGNLHIENIGAKIFLKDTTDDDDQAIYFQNNTATIEYVISTQDFTGAALGDGMFIGSVSNDELALVTSNTTALYINTLQNVGIGTTTPKAKLDINGHFCVDSKSHTITNAFTTCLTVNLTSHTGCHVIITAFGDWGSHSSAAYRGEFFLQNGANGYSEPGIILRQDDNTSDGTDQIICQIVDNPSTANPKDFQIQIRHTDTTSPASFDAQLTYTVQGKFNSIT